MVLFIFCKCENRCATLVRHGLWGATPHLPTVAYHMHLMDLVQCLRIESCVSVHGITSALSMAGIKNPLASQVMF